MEDWEKAKNRAHIRDGILAQAGQPPSERLLRGDLVVIQALRSVEHNGKQGAIMYGPTPQARFAVLLPDQGALLSIKRVNLVKVMDGSHWSNRAMVHVVVCDCSAPQVMPLEGKFPAEKIKYKGTMSGLVRVPPV